MVRHYHIKQNHCKEFYVAEKHCFRDMARLIEYHKHNAGGKMMALKDARLSQVGLHDRD